MDNIQSELEKIKAILKNSPQGMSITEIARALNKNNHSVGRYLDNLLVSGQVDMRMFGKAKVFTLSTRVPLDMMMGFADDMILVLDQDNRVVRINNQALTFFKKTKQDFLGRNIQFLIFPEQWITQFFETIRLSLAAGRKEDEIPGCRNDGAVFRQKNLPSVFEDGKKGITILLEDITARKKAESALRTSEEQFRLMAENINDGLIINEGKNTVFMNHRAEEIFGYTKEDFTAITPLDLAAPEERARLQKIFLESMSSETLPSEITFWIQRKDGSRRYINNRITTVNSPEKTTYYTISTDITEWKHTHDALENQLGFLQHMINTFPNPLFYLDNEGRFLGCNTSFSNLIGLPFCEIAGKTSAEIFADQGAGIFGDYNQEILKKGIVKTYSGQFQDRSGRNSTITIQKSGLVMTDGKQGGVVGLVLTTDKI